MRESVLSREFETILLLYNPLDEEGVGANGIFELAHQHGLGTIVMKALSGGALALPLKDEEREEKRRASGGQWFDPIARGSLRYVLSRPAVDSVIPGMRSVREVEENAPVGEMPSLTEAERDDLIQAIARLRGTFKYKQDCLRCGYCLSACPQEIQIPQVFHAMYAYRQYQKATRYIGLDIYRSLEVSPEECTECEACVEECPAGIPIPQRLKEAVELFEGIS
jgi:predicted aldo/keto reductase-like oxidoreductase